MSTPPSPSQAPSSLPHPVRAGERLADHMHNDPEVISERGATLASELTPLEVLDAIPLADLLTIPLDEPEFMQSSLIMESPTGIGASTAPPTEVMAPLSAAELTQKISRPSLETHQTPAERAEHETPHEVSYDDEQTEDLQRVEVKLTLVGTSYRSLSKLGWGSSALVAIMVYVYFASTESIYAGLNVQSALHWGANFPPEVVGGEREWWRLITAMFLHWDLSHLVFNLIALFWLGSQLERLLGLVGFISLFMCSATLAGIGTIYYYPDQVSLGASGGIYGLVGVLLMLSQFTQGERLNNALKQSILIGAWLLIAFGANLNSPWVDNASHSGGIIGGFLLGIFFAPLYGVKRMRAVHAWVWRLCGVLFTALSVALALHWASPPSPTFELLREYSSSTVHLRAQAAKLSKLSPLERRASWVAETKPRIDEFERRLMLIGDDLSRVRPSELRDVSDTEMWSLWRLITYWRHLLGGDFVAAGELPSAHLPPQVALRMYESLLFTRQTSHIHDQRWDERVGALKSVEYWINLPHARRVISDLSAELVAEASSSEVRGRGSLWEEPKVREWRLGVIEEVLSNAQSLTLRDQLTLSRLEWARGDLERVDERVGSLMRLPLSLQTASEYAHKDERSYLSLVRLWRRTLSAMLNAPDDPITVTYVKETAELHIKAPLESASRLYISSRSCETPSQATRPSWLLELSTPSMTNTTSDDELSLSDVTSTDPSLSVFTYHNGAQALPSCLTDYQVIGWRPFKSPSQVSTLGWRAYPLGIESN